MRTSDQISSAFNADLFDAYSVRDYLYQKHIHGNDIHAILNRNLVSSLTGAARDGVVSTDDGRQAIILLDFLRLSEVQLEPGISLAEYADTHHSAEPVDELDLLRKIDDIPNDNLHDLALGRTDKVLIADSAYHGLTRLRSEIGKAEDIHQWNLHYGYTLKMYLLHHKKLSKLDFVKEYQLWMWKDYAFGGVAFSFAATFASEKFGRMIKGINSLNRDKLINGLRNAAWDMTIVHYWCDCVVHRQDGDPFCVFCSADRGLKSVARQIVSSGTRTFADMCTSLLGDVLSRKELAEVVALCAALKKDSENPDRAVHAYRQKQDFFDPYIRDLEAEVLSHVDKRAQQTDESNFP